MTMEWTDFRQTINFIADVFSILTFLGLGILGIKVGRLIKKFGKKRLMEKLRSFLQI